LREGAQNEIDLAITSGIDGLSDHPASDPPVVKYTIPADGATNVLVNRAIIIVFDKPMRPNNMVDSILSSPNGNLHWDWSSMNTTLNSWSFDYLQRDTKYTITVTTDAMSDEGLRLRQNYMFSFTTGQGEDSDHPSIIAITPFDDEEYVDPLAKITITFSEPMLRSETEKAIEIRPSVTVIAVEWDQSGTILTLVPSILAKDCQYIIDIQDSLSQDLGGNRLAKSYMFVFYTGTKAGGLPTIYLAIIISIIIGIVIAIVFVILKVFRVARQWTRCPRCNGSIVRSQNICTACGYDLIRKTSLPISFKKGRTR
jgi:hypothetical protein